MSTFWENLYSGKDSIAAIEKDHAEYRRTSRNAAMQHLFSDREAYRAEREEARKRGDVTMARSLNAKIANCTRKMNILLLIGIDETIARNKAAKTS
jgi:hypothetical protein